MDNQRRCADGREVIGMPGYDGRGPRGMGPMTGRGLGWCVEDNVSAWNPRSPQSGYGRQRAGRGRGGGYGMSPNDFSRGFGENRTSPGRADTSDMSYDLQKEFEALKTQTRAIQQAVENLERRFDTGENS